MENKPILPNPPPNDPVLVETIDNSQSNLMSGFIGAFLGAVIGAVLWAVIVFFTGYTFSFMAIGVGYVVGLAAVRLAGNGSMLLGMIAGVCALGGTVLGGLLVMAVGVAWFRELSPLELLLSGDDLSFVIASFTRSFEITDAVFYVLAVASAFRIAREQKSVVKR